MISLENTRFNPCVKQNDGGSTFLGYLGYCDLVVEDGIDEGEDLSMGLPDIEVRITVEGKQRIDFPEDERSWTGRDGEDVEKRVARYFTSNAASRRALTAAVFALPSVKRAVKQGAKLRKTAKVAAIS
jgi:hypothetical protein